MTQTISLVFYLENNFLNFKTKITRNIVIFRIGEINVIRCDDVFVDTDVNQFAKICQLIRQYNFEHLIGITPLGEGKKLWVERKRFWKIHFLTKHVGFFINYRINRMAGSKHIWENAQLIRLLDAEFNKYSAIPGLHGLHHYKYDVLPQNRVREELYTGIKTLEKLFNIRVKVFTPPFNAWNCSTEFVCNSLNLSIDKCREGFDMIENMSDLEIVELAKEQSSISEVYYHPYRIKNLKKFELYLKNRKEYS